MTLEKAIEILKEKYEQAKDNSQINDPVAWALYRTWSIPVWQWQVWSNNGWRLRAGLRLKILHKKRFAQGNA